MHCSTGVARRCSSTAAAAKHRFPVLCRLLSLQLHAGCQSLLRNAATDPIAPLRRRRDVACRRHRSRLVGFAPSSSSSTFITLFHLPCPLNFATVTVFPFGVDWGTSKSAVISVTAKGALYLLVCEKSPPTAPILILRVPPPLSTMDSTTFSSDSGGVKDGGERFLSLLLRPLPPISFVNTPKLEAGL